MANYKALSDLRTDIKGYIKALKGSKDDLIDDLINMVYLDEVMVCDDLYPLFWMVDFVDSYGIKAPADISGITGADPADITSTAHGFTAGNIVSVYDVGGMVELNNRTYRCGTPADANSLGLELLDSSDEIDSSAYTAYTSGGVINHQGHTLSEIIRRIIKVRVFIT